MGLSEIINNRLANVSFIAAICVVSRHIGTSAEGVLPLIKMLSYLTELAVPMFFFISGYYLAKHMNESGWWERAMAQRARTLLIPLVLSSVLCWMCTSFVIILANMISNREIFSMIRVEPNIGVYWYLRSLFLFVLVSPVLLWLVHKSAAFFLVTMFMVCLAFEILRARGVSDVVLYLFDYFFSLRGLFCFILGISVRIKIKEDLFARILGFLMPVARRWSVANMSFPLYVMHAFLLAPISALNKHLPLCGELTFFIKWVGVIALSLMLALWFKKFMPRFASLLFGGR